MFRSHQILLTGCCGFLGSWITVALLRAGHRVRGTSQDPDHARRLFSEALSGASEVGLAERLEVVHAELLDAGSWAGLADGCEVLVHTACPMVSEVDVPREAMIDPAVVGTEHVLREAARAGGVRRVLHMSSIVALLDHHRPVPETGGDEVVGPADWNDTASAATDPYAAGKVLGERRARALVTDLLPGATFAAILPGPVIGPRVAGDQVPDSVERTLAPLLTGQLRWGSVALHLGLVDVRDVAAAFVAAVALPEERLASLGEGTRFVCTAQPSTSLQDLADILRRDFPAYARRLPRRPLPLPRALLLLAMRPALTREAWSYTRAMLGRRVQYDVRLTEATLGVRFRPVADSVGDTVRWLQSRGHFPPP